MKKYIKPSIKTVEIESNAILAGSGMDTLGRGYNEGDASYGKGMDDNWDEEDF